MSDTDTLTCAFAGQRFIASVHDLPDDYDDIGKVEIAFEGRHADRMSDQLVFKWAHPDKDFANPQRVYDAIASVAEAMGFVAVPNPGRGKLFGICFFDLVGDLSKFNPEQFITCIAYELRGMAE